MVFVQKLAKISRQNFLLDNTYTTIDQFILFPSYTHYFTLQIMGKMIQNYSLQNEIGKGMYSTVYKAINMKNKQEVAIKMVRADKFKQYPKLEEGTYNEINILTNLEPCSHIIKYFDMLKTANNFYFVYQFCNGGTLEKLLKEKGILPQKVAITYFSQIVQAFRVLNKHNIMHRDLKPQNLLLHDGIIKLADFGFCKPLENQDQISKTMLGSPIYMAPQILKGQTYSIKSDIWSLGVVFFRMLYGFCPFQSNNIGKLIMIIQQQDIVIPKNPSVSPEIIKLLRRMITKNPNLRAEWSEIFSYTVKNGQLVRSSLKDTTPKKSALKRSFTLTETTSVNSNLMGSQNLQSVFQNKQPQKSNSTLIYNPKTNNQLRSTFAAKSPFRQNFKKDILVKNHQKCIEIISLAITLTVYQRSEALALAFLFIRNTEKQLWNLNQSAKKQYQMKNDEAMMKNFIQIVQAQLSQLKKLMIDIKQELKGELQFSVDLIEMKKKELLRRFINSLSKQKIEELVLASRVADYIIDQLVIRKETLQKMSKDKLISNIKAKIQSL